MLHILNNYTHEIILIMIIISTPSVPEHLPSHMYTTALHCEAWCRGTRTALLGSRSCQGHWAGKAGESRVGWGQVIVLVLEGEAWGKEIIEGKKPPYGEEEKPQPLLLLITHITAKKVTVKHHPPHFHHHHQIHHSPHH